MDGAAPCRFFQTPGGCLRGAACTYRHEYAPGTAPAPRADEQARDSAPAPDAESAGYPPMPMMPMNMPMNMSAPPCRFFGTAAGCRNGLACPFVHLGVGGFAPPANTVSNTAQEGLQVQIPASASSTGTAPPLPPSDPSDPTGMGMAPSFNGMPSKPRRKLDIQRNPSKKAQFAVSSEIIPVLTREIKGPFYAIDVECVATGTGTEDRDVARIAAVDEDEELIYEQYVMPGKPIVSYLTQLTGITASNLEGAPCLADALVELRRVLPTNCVIVGQSIKKDLDWLGLVKGTDYREAFDVAALFRVPMQSRNGTIRYRCFSLRHVAKYLLGQDIQAADHDPAIDAKYALKLFKQFRYLHESPGRRDAVYQTLLQTPRTPSFADRYPVIDGVMMKIPRKRRDYRDTWRPPQEQPTEEDA